MASDAQERAKAQFKEALNSLGSKLGRDTPRMAGAAFAGAMAPSLVSYVDDQETNFGGFMASGLIGAGGTGLGGYLGYRNSHLGEAARDPYIREQVKELKVQAQAQSALDNAQSGINNFAENKRLMLQDIDPIDPKRAAVFNNTMRGIPDIGAPIADMNLLNRTPREIRGTAKGAMLGAIASALPAYLALRNGDIE